jgi:dihydroceramidase
MQLVDELSMIYTTCLMFHATFSYGKTLRFSIAMGAFLTGLALFITLYYHYLQDPTFHQNAYALLTAIVLFRSIYVMETLRPSLKKHAQKRAELQQQNGHTPEADQAEVLRQERRDSAILKTMWIMVAYGLSIFLGGFAIWGVDIKYCGTLRRWRREIGLPWGVLLEGHGWWCVHYLLAFET